MDMNVKRSLNEIDSNDDINDLYESLKVIIKLFEAS